MDEIIIDLQSPLTLQLLTRDNDYLSVMKRNFTSYVEGYQFMARYRSGGWDGKICLINQNGTFPYGILVDVVRVHLRNFKDIKLKMTPKVKQLFRGNEVKLHYDLKYDPRPYQDDCIKASLRYSKGIIRSATASGKSLVIAYIIYNLLKNDLTEKAIIIVPSTSLIKQFHTDLIEYNFDYSIGEVYAKKKEWKNDVVISTWQSLVRNKTKLKDFNCVIVDEVHGSKANELKKILKHSPARYRLGFTGTMHDTDLDNWNTKAYLGAIIREYTSGQLASEGWISKCNIKILNMKYKESRIDGDYNVVKEVIFENEYRMKLIKRIVRDLDHNVLLLVGKVNKEGKVLEEFLKNDCGKTVKFLSGRDDVDLREKWRNICRTKNNIALIATYGIFQQGINIPNLKYIVLSAPFKSKIRVLQSIGRALRKHENKEDGAYIFDINDQVKYLKRHGKIRLKYYQSENFAIDSYDIIEGIQVNVKGFLED